MENKRSEIDRANGGRRVKIVVGDQADPAVLKRWIETSGGEFDVIVEDGGHTQQQWVSIIHLWQAIKPGGMYVMEDLAENFLPMYGIIADECSTGEDRIIQRVSRLVGDISFVWSTPSLQEQ